MGKFTQRASQSYPLDNGSLPMQRFERAATGMQFGHMGRQRTYVGDNCLPLCPFQLFPLLRTTNQLLRPLQCSGSIRQASESASGMSLAIVSSRRARKASSTLIRNPSDTVKAYMKQHRLSSNWCKGAQRPLSHRRPRKKSPVPVRDIQQHPSEKILTVCGDCNSN